MNFENSNGNAGNSYHSSYTYNYVTVADSFNVTNKNSHNGHGRASGCAVLVPLLLLAIPVIISIVLCNVLAGWLT